MADTVAWEEEICTCEKQIVVVKDDTADNTNTHEVDKNGGKGLCSRGFKITVEPILLLFGVANYPLNPLTQQVKISTVFLIVDRKSTKLPLIKLHKNCVARKINIEISRGAYPRFSTTCVSVNLIV